MPVLNFLEIPEAHLATGKQDTFELFARDFLKFLGYRIILEPDRGADGGKDLIIEEKRTGIAGETTIRWLVSCKHKAHSKRSVTPQDESNINDRVSTHDCAGFIGFYSTVTSSGLAGNLEGLKNRFSVQTFDNEKIESQLLSSSDGLLLAKRYFPASIATWHKENPQPVKIFKEEPSIKCDYCEKELLDKDARGIFVKWLNYQRQKDEDITFYEHIYFCCKGHCDRQLKSQVRKPGWIDSWMDIPDIIIPTGYIRMMIAITNNYHSGEQFSDQAHDKIKNLILNIFPYVARECTTGEQDRLDILSLVPRSLGGLG